MVKLPDQQLLHLKGNKIGQSPPEYPYGLMCFVQGCSEWPGPPLPGQDEDHGGEGRRAGGHRVCLQDPGL